MKIAIVGAGRWADCLVRAWPWLDRTCLSSRRRRRPSRSSLGFEHDALVLPEVFFDQQRQVFQMLQVALPEPGGQLIALS